MLVIRHRNCTFKSTPFQTVFSEKALKARDNKKNKHKDLTLTVNDTPIDLPMRIDPTSGRVQFQKVFYGSCRNIFGRLETCLIHPISQMIKGYRTDQVLNRGEYQAVNLWDKQ